MAIIDKGYSADRAGQLISIEYITYTVCQPSAIVSDGRGSGGQWVAAGGEQVWVQVPLLVCLPLRGNCDFSWRERGRAAERKERESRVALCNLHFLSGNPITPLLSTLNGKD